jgi:hypothetical protein
MTMPADPVRELAYSLWEQRGKPNDNAEQDWFEAERLLATRRRHDDQRVDEAERESFPASDAPATSAPDRVPANADAKWVAADAAKPRPSRGRSGSRAAAERSDGDVARKPAETPKLGSSDAPGG